ncbi:hypothetical protein ACFFK0_15415 [Paenibacillus chartarius]|uniref:Uncharacterized protein n=1 Tax=Paenibacillus chartarius TaxID=747481 RepID=A0ABV6DME2_9BACL
MRIVVTLLSQFRHAPAQQSQQLGEDDVAKKWYACIVKECETGRPALPEPPVFFISKGFVEDKFPEPFRRGDVLYGQQTTV